MQLPEPVWSSVLLEVHIEWETHQFLESKKLKSHVLYMIRLGERLCGLERVYLLFYNAVSCCIMITYLRLLFLTALYSLEKTFSQPSIEGEIFLWESRE